MARFASTSSVVFDSTCFDGFQSLPDAPSQPAAQSSIYQTVLNHVRASRMTDAELIYTPSQIALASLSLVSPDLASQWAGSKFPSKIPESAASLTTLQEAIEAIKGLITSHGHPPNVESVREVDRRLKLCKNPEKVIGSNAYLARKAEAEKKAEEKRNRKAIEVQKAMIDGDPFGSELNSQVIDDDDDDED